MLSEGLIPPTVAEVRRLLYRLLWLPLQSAQLVIGWSHWRRRHQARARRCHYQAQLRRASLQVRL
jgi:hypothetical protein